jgi:ribosomal protein S18 acetylase RimI-like enzyme
VIAVRPLAEQEVAEVDRPLPLHRLDQSDGQYLVAWEDGVPVGHAHVDWRTDPPELQDVYVPEAQRRRGIAQELSRAAEELVRARGFDRIALDVDLENHAARALYAKLGYRERGTPPSRHVGTILLRGEPFSFDVMLLDLIKDLD